ILNTQNIIGSFRPDDYPIIIVRNFTVPVLIYKFYITRFIPICCGFIGFVRLPYPRYFIIIKWFHGLSNKPVISDIHGYTSRQFGDLIFIFGEIYGRRPSKIFIIYINGIQKNLYPLIPYLAYIGHYIGKPGRIWNFIP